MDELNEKVSHWLSEFENSLQNVNTKAIDNLFTEDCFWRDLVSFTWNIKTLEGKQSIKDMLNEQAKKIKPSNFLLEGDASGNDDLTEAWFTFETGVSRGRGQIRLKNNACWTLLTTMIELKGYEEKQNKTRPKGAEHTASKTKLTWSEKMEKEQKELGYTKQPYCLVVGGGQGGIGLGARLRQLDVPTIIIDKNKKPGDAWRKRYKSLCLHDPVWYDHLPYLPFPKNWPIFSPKDKIGDWLEMYAKVMELNYWHSTVCESATYDEAKKEWEVKLIRDGEKLTLRPTQLVLATGMSGRPNIPDIKGMDKFKGDIHHSSAHPGGEQFKDKKCVVLGSNNSSHDICGALWENGADVTMIQRSSTHIIKSDPLMKHVLGGLYSEEAIENGIDHHKADLIFASVPYKIMPEFHIPVYETVAKEDATFYKKLKDVGFMLDFGDDGSGLFMKYLRRGSGYYIDVGSSQLLIDKKVKLKSGVNIDRITENSIILTNGEEIPADVIVLATGFKSMNGWAAEIISQKTADKVGKCWGLGSDTTKDPGPWEGELRNMWKPTLQDALWFHGGNLHQSRHYSQFLSLQIKARMENIPTPVYGMTPVHHLS